MNVLFTVSGIIAIVVLLIDFLLIFLWRFNFKKYSRRSSYHPRISILVAARNEEQNIEKCVHSLLHLNYPKDRYEILVGDDRSSDSTPEILKTLSGTYKQVSVHFIHNNKGSARGKANVLAHLAEIATGEFYFITDADCIVGKDWIQSLLAAHEEGVGITIGTTGVASTFQNMEWLLALGMLKVINDLGRPVTAMGNNMYITREAYDSVGGYASIPFSITEDYELFKQVSRKDFATRHVVAPDGHVMTQPVATLNQLMHQRKRWMNGAMQLPLPVVLLLLFQALYYPALVFTGLKIWWYGLSLLLLKSMVQAFFILLVGRRVGSPVPFFQLISFELYSGLVSVLTSVYYILPFKIKWKGRKY